MFQNYINNLYKNLVFYRLENLNFYTDFFQKKSFEILKGGNMKENLSELNQSLETLNAELIDIINKVKQNPQSTQSMSSDNDQILRVKKSSIKAIVDVIQHNIDTITQDQTKVISSIEHMTEEESLNKLKQIEKTITAVNNSFKELI